MPLALYVEAITGCASVDVCVLTTVRNPRLLDIWSDNMLQYYLIECTRAGAHVSDLAGAKYFKHSPPQQCDGQQMPFICRAMNGQEVKFNVWHSTTLKSFVGGLPIRGKRRNGDPASQIYPSRSCALKEKLGKWIALPVIQMSRWLKHSISLHRRIVCERTKQDVI